MAKFGLPGGGRRTRQPQYPVRVDQSSPQAAQLVGLFCGGISPERDATGNPPLTLKGVALLTPTDRGLALKENVTNSSGLYSLDAPRFDLPVAHSISAWIKPTSTADQIIVWKGQDSLEWGSYALKIGICDAGGISFKINYTIRSVNDGANITVSQSAAAVALDVWTHITATHDGATLSLYINGKLDATIAGGAGYPYAGAARFAIGFDAPASFASYRWPSTGPLQDVRLYSGCLSPAIVKQIYNEPWRVFQPLKRNIYVDAAASGTTLIELTAATFSWTKNAIQNRALVTLSAPTLRATAQSIQNRSTIAASLASLTFAAQSIQNRAAVTLTAATISFVGKALQNKLTIALSVASFSFIAWAINVTGAAASVVARLLSLLGVGS